MQPYRIKHKIRQLDTRRRHLLARLMQPEEMVAGSVYRVYKKCGNPRCRCTKGEKHGPFTCLSLTDRGKRKLVFVRRDDEVWVKLRATRYRRYQKMMANVRKMNDEIFELLKVLRDGKVNRYF